LVLRRRVWRRRLRSGYVPWCDRERTSCAAACGPTPGWSSSCGASACVSASISRASSRSSTVSCSTLRAIERSASRLPRSSGSCLPPGRVAASRCTRRARVSGRSSLRSGSGVVINRSRSWQSAARFASTAPARAATSACSACLWPPARGVEGRTAASTLRAARIASSASVLPPVRRSLRSRPTSSTRSPRPSRKRVSPRPNEPVPSTANARRPCACCSTNASACA